MLKDSEERISVWRPEDVHDALEKQGCATFSEDNGVMEIFVEDGKVICSVHRYQVNIARKVFSEYNDEAKAFVEEWYYNIR